MRDFPVNGLSIYTTKTLFPYDNEESLDSRYPSLFVEQFEKKSEKNESTRKINSLTSDLDKGPILLEGRGTNDLMAIFGKAEWQRTSENDDRYREEKKISRGILEN